MKKKSFFNSTLFFRLLSLGFAILLVFYVNHNKLIRTSKQGNLNSNQTQLMSTRRDHVSVPLQLNVNNSKYFVTGYPDKVNVTLSGPAALVTTTVNTQNFKTYVDLSKYGVGKHRIRIAISGLNSDLNYRINPSYITVNIQPRENRRFPIKAEYDHSKIAPGYKAGNISTSDGTVKATGAFSDINKIDRVIAKINLPDNTRKTISYQTILEALDKRGKTVNVILTPATTNVNLPVSSNNSKTVPIKLNAVNASEGKKYTLKSNTSEVKVLGSEKQLAAIKKVVANVDVSDIKSTTTRTIVLDENMNKVSGFSNSKIKVRVIVK